MRVGGYSLLWAGGFLLGVAIRVRWSCLRRVNNRFSIVFVNPNTTQIINGSEMPNSITRLDTCNPFINLVI